MVLILYKKQKLSIESLLTFNAFIWHLENFVFLQFYLRFVNTLVENFVLKNGQNF